MAIPTAWRKYMDLESSLLPAAPTIGTVKPIESDYSVIYRAAVRRAADE
jgi:hypothetical protein